MVETGLRMRRPPRSVLHEDCKKKVADWPNNGQADVSRLTFESTEHLGKDAIADKLEVSWLPHIRRGGLCLIYPPPNETKRAWLTSHHHLTFL